MPIILKVGIEKDFGLKLRIGAELEFCAFPLEGEDKDPLKLETDSPHLVLFKGNDHFSEFLVRDSKEPPSNLYEVIFRHTDTQDRNVGPIILSTVIDRVRKHLLQVIAPERKVEITFDPLSKAVEKDIPVTCALQTNIDLLDGLNNSILKQEQDRGMTRLGRQLARASLPMQAETVLLCAPEENSYKRFQALHSGAPGRVSSHTQSGVQKASVAFREGADKHGNTPRLENRLAGADADPYCVVLATLAQTYDALANLKYSRISRQYQDADTPEVYANVPHTRAEAAAHFTKGRLLKDLLNKQRDGLGDELCAQVLKDLEPQEVKPDAAPPGGKKSLWER